MMPSHSCQTAEEVEPLMLTMIKVLTTKQADFVNKELNASNGTMSIKKVVIQNKSVYTELENAYQKTLIIGTENNNKEKSPTQMKKWSILGDHVKYVTSDGSEVFSQLEHISNEL